MPRHLLQLEGLDATQLTALLDRAEALLPAARAEVAAPAVLDGRLVAHLFFEDSTRTRLSFEAATARLGGRSLELTESGSSTSKGETFLDTALNVEALGVDAIVVRTSLSGGPQLLARHVRCPVINAGDGRHEHPTQGLLDCLTIRRALGSIEGARIAIVGDIANSRVARSALHALTTLGAQVRLIGPPTLLPRSFGEIAQHRDRVAISHDLDANLADLDAIMMLRIQLERAAGGAIASDYRIHYGLTRERAARLPARCIVLHPGPVNRGVEVDDDVADDTRRSQILRQVTHGVAVRMAVLEYCLQGVGTRAAAGA
ncbi:MAG: aspartate carbamoyltransferase catalytic subunit [Phycisphaerales bacterium]